ncbi:N-alpha-acetyltransferase 30 [Tiliqua scincoides]|uniref:N-alpha-acetyltransferase 30 n=1 Tax=Tiliqua scincoides TaxID=71010 RepID=UPI00346292EC
MAEVPPGPSSLLAPPPPPGDAVALLLPLPGAAAEEEEEEEGRRRGRPREEEEGDQGARGGRRRPCPPPHRRPHQLNGLIAAPDLLRLRGSLKGKAPSGGLEQQPPGPLQRLPRPQARTAQPPSAGDRNGLAGAEEEEQEEGRGPGPAGREEEALLLLSRSLASCGLQGPPTDSPRAPPEALATHYVRYQSELQMPDIMRLITKDLSEPYSIYTYRYFIHNWPQLCFLAMVGDECVGAIVCKLDMHKKMFRRGYIAMLAVDSKYRRKNIGTNLVKKAIYAMVEGDCDEVVLETEITNKSALKLYENLGFVRDKRLFRYYLNGVDALRLKLWLR